MSTKPNLPKFLQSLKQHKSLGFGGLNKAMDWLIYPEIPSGKSQHISKRIYTSQIPHAGEKTPRVSEKDYRRMRQSGALKALAFAAQNPYLEEFPEIENSEDSPFYHSLGNSLKPLGYHERFSPIEALAFMEGITLMKERGNPYTIMVDQNNRRPLGELDIELKDIGVLDAFADQTENMPKDILNEYIGNFDLDIPWHYPMWRPEALTDKLPKKLQHLLKP